MRIALVAEDYYPQLGGVPEHTNNLALQLIRASHNVTVVTSHMKPPVRDPDFVERVGTSRVIYANGGVSRVTTGWALRRRLEELFRSGRYDIVHVQGGLAPTFGIVAPLAADRVGIPVVATFHSWFETGPAYRIFRRPLQHLLDRHAATIAVSRPVADLMSRYFSARWEIIPNGVDIDLFRPVRRPDFEIDSRPPRLLFLGRIEPRNRLGVMLRAMPYILRHCPAARLVVAGDGPWLGYYQRRARRFGANVQFVGRVLAERVEWYNWADLYVCPTRIASFGVTLLEAAACGTPMVATDNVGYRALVADGPEAVLVSPDDPAAWAAVVVALLKDPERRRAMSRAGPIKAAQFSWPIVARQELAVYRRVTGAPACAATA
jgi:phosphatidylinositol alpha-mannosyltransferase